MKVRFALLAATLCVAFACQTTDDERWKNDRPQSFKEMKLDLMKFDPTLSEFEGEGPFSYELQENVAFDLGSKGLVIADVVVAGGAGKAPLVILVHGNHSAKEAHRYQAEHLASYGMHAVVVQLKNRAQWMKNGRIIAALVRSIAKRPSLVSTRIDPKSIILVGHSFGGSAITVAAGRGAPVKGLILLDPAVVGQRVMRYMRKVDEPAVLLGADRSIYRARKRRLFFKNMGGEFGEISVRGATHDDAQHPSMFSLAALGFDPYTSRANQQLFSTAIAASAFSIAATGSIDWAWKSFKPETRRGRLASPRRKLAKGDG